MKEKLQGKSPRANGGSVQRVIRRQPRTNLKAQEEVVSALYEFAHTQQHGTHNAFTQMHGKRTGVNLEAVGNALESILRSFGYEKVIVV